MPIIAKNTLKNKAILHFYVYKKAPKTLTGNESTRMLTGDRKRRCVMGLPTYPFIEEEEEIKNLIRKTVRQYAVFDTARIREEIRRKLRLHSHRTTSDIIVTVFRHGLRRFLVYADATAPSGRRCEFELEVRV